MLISILVFQWRCNLKPFTIAEQDKAQFTPLRKRKLRNMHNDKTLKRIYRARLKRQFHQEVYDDIDIGSAMISVD